MTGETNGLPLLGLLGQLGVPALVSVVVTFLLNLHLEKRRGRREVNNRAFDSAREDVRKLSEIAVSYWARDGREDDVEIETKMVLIQEDVLVAVGDAIELTPKSGQGDVEAAIDELLRLWTGGDFQVPGRKMDLRRARSIPGAAARLRSALSRARRVLLEKQGS